MFRTFVAELKRRKVLRVGGVYAVVGWGILRGADELFPLLNLPPWSVTLVAALLLAAFPIALIITWAFEITPDGVKRTEGTAQEFTTPRGIWIEASLLVGIVVVIGISVADRFDDGAASEDVLDDSLINSIAVLPFTSFSDDAESNYFADGLTEEIIHDLAQLSGLKVSGRTSSFHFKNRNEDLREIGKALGVANVLEGSVRRADGRVRITVQLVAASDGFHLWSQTYDRGLDNMFAIQDDVASSVATVLAVRLGDGARDAPTTTAGAPYEQYLIALALLEDGGLEALTRARAIFQALSAARPDDVDALAGFARATIYLAGAYLTLDFESAAAEAIAAIERALAIDVRSVNANATAGFVYTAIAHRTDERRYLTQAEQVLARAAARAPSDADVLTDYGGLLNELGRHAEALTMLRDAVDRDPFAAPAMLQLAMALQGLGRLADARAHLERMLERFPNHDATHLELGELLVAQGLLVEALPHVERAHASHTNPRASFVLAHIFANLGMTAELERVIHDGDYSPIMRALGQAILFNVHGDDAATQRLARDQLDLTGDRIWRPLLVSCALINGDLATARSEIAILDAQLLSPSPTITNSHSETILAAADLLRREGATEQSRWLLERLLERLAPIERSYDPATAKILRAKALAALERDDEAMVELEAARLQGFRTLWDFDNFQRLDRTPQFAALGHNPRFRAFVAAIEAANAAAREQLTQYRSTRRSNDSTS